jgi:hypothetical protein
METLMMFSRIPALLAAAASIPSVADAEEVSFSREIQPILSENCYFCHGPDEAKREAGLRLDTFAGATAERPDSAGPAVVPGDAEASPMIRRMRSRDPEMVMPPPDSHLTVAPEEIAQIARWIDQGAEYETHWAFTPLPEKVAVPTDGDGWARHPIDRFVARAHAAENLEPAPEAPAWKLRRRTALDLTGLPPDLAADGSHEEHTEALLASPHYGEAMALPWLDAARYADSYGYQADKLSPQWPWRDWVIRAFNDNLPYDRFATWQIAGDLLPEASRDQRLATAFNRLHRMTTEGGTVHEEYRIEGVDDRVATFGTAFLALTLDCSRCHDHKYDPITARDYYSLTAFFNSIPERGVYSHSSIAPGPALLVPTPGEEKRLAALRAKREAAQRAHRSHVAAPPETDLEPLTDEIAAFDFQHRGKDGVTPNAVDNREDGKAITARAKQLDAIDSPGGGALRFDGDHGISVPGLLEADWPQPWTIDVMAKVPATPDGAVVLWHRTFGTDIGFNGYECLIEDGRIHARVVRDWPGSAAAVRSEAVLEEDTWHRITVRWDGGGRAAGLRIAVDGRALATTVEYDSLRQSVLGRTHGRGHFTLGQRFRDRGLRGGAVESLRVFDRDLTDYELRVLHDPDAPPPDAAARAALWKSAHDPQARALRDESIAAGQELVAFETRVHSVAVMRESPEPRPTWLLPRGAYDAPRLAENRVERRTFSQILPPFSDEYPPNRLGLARWLTRPDHPLTARVFVNRMWQHFFGTGLVETSDNFGFQGSPPTHPQLLDWLARDFVDHGWDIKRLCRQIVGSATYRQDSAVAADKRAADPDNRRLARGPSHRLGAEAIRDLALAGSGMLERDLGGPPVSPYQPGPDLWRESNAMSPAYRQSVDEGLLRRSIYSVWKRTAPLPNAVLFDAPGRASCVTKRPTTNTPLQALVLLNDTQFVEPARATADAVLRAHPDDPGAQLDEAFRRFAGRAPDTRERTILRATLEEQHGFFADRPEAVREFLDIGEFRHGEGLDPAALAATTVVCQLILNSDAAIWKR